MSMRFVLRDGKQVLQEMFRGFNGNYIWRDVPSSDNPNLVECTICRKGGKWEVDEVVGDISEGIFALKMREVRE